MEVAVGAIEAARAGMEVTPPTQSPMPGSGLAGVGLQVMVMVAVVTALVVDGSCMTTTVKPGHTFTAWVP